MDWLEAAYRAHRGDVLAAAMGVLHDREAAEDVVQEVFLRLGRDCAFDASRGTLGAYLRMLGRSRALDAHRARGAFDRTRERWLRSEPGRAEPAVASTADQVHDATERARLRAAVRTLPPLQREAVALTYWGDMSHTAVAAHTGTPLGTVKSRVRLGLERLRSLDAAA